MSLFSKLKKKIGKKQDPKTEHIELQWEVDEKELERTEEIYKKLVPSFFGRERKLILPLLRILRVAQQNNKPRLLLDLVDIFSRERVRQYTNNKKTDFTVNNWVETDEYVACITDGKQQPKTLIKEAIESFFKRSHSKIRFNSLEKINDALEPFVLYVQEALTFIQTHSDVTPFQIDLMIIPAAVVKENDDDNDDDSEEDSEEDGGGSDDEKKDVSIMSDNFNVEECLKESNCIFVSQMLQDNSPLQTFTELYKQFQDNNFVLNKKRICIIADRRRNKSSDENASDILYMYLPPKGNEIETDIPETFIQTSSECVLPRAQSDDPITSRTADTGFFMLSFHVVQKDVIKCYLYQRHQICRFFPNDVINLWPCLFLNDGNDLNDNRNFNDLLKQLVISDHEFDQVYKSNEGNANDIDNDEQ